LAVGAEQYPASGSAAAQGSAAQTLETASQAFDRVFTSGLAPEERAKVNAVLKDAHGFVVLPNVLKVGIGLTQIQGLGVLVYRDAKGAAAEVENVKRAGYRPGNYLEGNAELRAVLELIHFARGDAEVFRPLAEKLTQSGPFLVLADHAVCQEQVGAAWRDADKWTRMSILNTARSGKFSSDRAIAEYCDGIWNVSPVTVKL
jgi:hypothetical protein